MKLCAVSDSLEICHSKRPARVSADLGIGWPVLLAFSAGAAGDKSELRSNSELVAALMVSLRKMYGKEIPEPSGYLVTRWN
jgi:hypothetical protein